MAESLNTNISIQLNDGDTNTVTRFYNDTFSLEPSDYRYGKKSISAGETEYLLAEQFNYVFFKSDSNVEYKIDVGGEPHNGNCFFHSGNAIDLYVSNTSDATIELEYVCANIA